MYHPYQYGGAETVLRTISEGFVARGHQVQVLASVPRGEEREVDNNGVQTHFLPSQSFYWPFDKQPRSNLKKLLWHAQNIRNYKMAELVAAEVARFKPDVMVTHNLLEFSIAAWEAVQAAGVPIVHVLHDYGLLCPRTTIFRNGQICSGQPNQNTIDPAARCASCRLLSVGKQGATAFINGVIGVSQAVLDVHLSAGYFEHTSIRQIINNALPESDLHHFIERDYQGKTDITIGFIGKLVPDKGIEVLLESLARVQARRQWKLLVGGSADPSYLASLKARFPMGNIEFMGFIKSADFYPKVDLLIVPSIWRDPYPTVIFEAYSYGVPVFGSRRGGIPEAILAGKTGELFEPDNPDELAALLTRFIEQPGLLQAYVEPVRQELGRYKISRQIDEHLSVYQRVIAQHSLAKKIS